MFRRSRSMPTAVSPYLSPFPPWLETGPPGGAHVQERLPPCELYSPARRLNAVYQTTARSQPMRSVPGGPGHATLMRVVGVRIGLLASREGSNAQAVIDACSTGRVDGKVATVISNNS